MKRHIQKYILIPAAVFLSAIILFVSGTALLVYLYPEESVLNMIRSKAEESLGRKVEINSLKYSIKGVLLNGVTIWDRDSNGNQSEYPILKSEEAIISYSLISIIKRDFKIKTLYFNKLIVRLTFDNSGISNFEKIYKELKPESESDEYDGSPVKISKIILTDCKLIITNPPRVVKPLEGEYLVNSTISVKKGTRFSLTNTGIELPQGRGRLYPEIEINTDKKLHITGIIKLEDCSLNWVYGFPLKPLNLPFDTVNGLVDNFELSLPEIKGHAKVTSSVKRSKSLIHAEGSCVINIEDETVIISDGKSRLNNSSAVLNDLFISTKAGEVRRFNVSNLNYSISDLRILENNIPAGFSGNIKGSLSFNSSKYNGKIQITNCSYKDRTEVFSGLNTEIELVNNVFKKESIPVMIFGSSFNVSVAATDSNFKNIYVFIKGDKLDVNRINLSGGKSSSDFFFPVNISGKIQLGELVYDNFIFRNNHADFAASEKTIKLNRVDTSVFSGTLNGSGRIDLSGEYPSAHISAKFSSMKIHDVKFSNENLNNRLFGFADGSVNLDFGLKEKMTETIKGNTIFSVSKGKVVNTGIQNGLIIFLAELRYKLKDLEFNKIYGNIDVNGRDFTINTFIFNSEDIRLSMNGKINSDLDAKNMSMKLEFNNHFIKDIPRPAIAVFNEYINGKWYIIPFSLNGSITESKNIKMLKKD